MSANDIKLSMPELGPHKWKDIGARGSYFVCEYCKQPKHNCGDSGCTENEILAYPEYEGELGFSEETMQELHDKINSELGLED